jgi:hypothetical protein
VNGESAWIEVPQDGQDVKQLELPAPAFVISAADKDGHHGATSGTAAAAEAHSEASAATGKSNDAQPLTIAALAAGILGSILGGTALVQQRRRT